MNRRNAVIGLSLSCALVFCAFAAPSAVALKGTTAYECRPVENGKTGFTDEHCTEEAGAGKASFEHVLIPAGPTKVTVTNKETKNSTVVRMKATLLKNSAELEAKKFTSCLGTIENVVNGKGQMEVSGKGCGEFGEVTVTKPLNCKVKEPIVLNSGLAGNTEVEEVEKKPVGGTGYFPPPKEIFTSVTFEGEKCALKGATFNITGTVHANMPLEEGRLDGPTLRFTTAQTEKTLKIGGSPAAFEGTFTLSAASETVHPIALTTSES